MCDNTVPYGFCRYPQTKQLRTSYPINTLDGWAMWCSALLHWLPGCLLPARFKTRWPMPFPALLPCMNFTPHYGAHPLILCPPSLAPCPPSNMCVCLPRKCASVDLVHQETENLKPENSINPTTHLQAQCAGFEGRGHASQLICQLLMQRSLLSGRDRKSGRRSKSGSTADSER